MGHVYKTTNIINGKYYIGSHDGSKPNYIGSGLLLAHAVKKYGRDNFSTEILYEGDDYREVEGKVLCQLDCANDVMSYNLKNEVWGGSFPGERNGMFGKKLSPEERYRCGNAFRGKSRPDHSAKLSGERNPMFGKNEHTHGLRKRAAEQKGKTLDQIHGIEKSLVIRENLSRSHLGKKHNLKRVVCPHCGKEGKGPNMTRYHFDNCKTKS